MHLRLGLFVVFFGLAGSGLAQTGAVTWDKPVPRNFTEPAWLDQGIVFVGNWEPLDYRRRSGGQGSGGLPVDVEEMYRREHTPETVKRLAKAGVNFIITHFYKTGLAADREDIEVTKKFVTLCHAHGIKVGAYVGGTIFSETLLRDSPQAKDWIARDEYGVPIRYPYGSTTAYRYVPDFGHPGYIQYMKEVVRIAIQEAKVDLIHFDNAMLPTPPETGDTPEINRRFRAFLRKKYTSEELKSRFGSADISTVAVPTWHGVANPSAVSPINDPLVQEWIDFRCDDFSAYYGEMASWFRERLFPAGVKRATTCRSPKRALAKPTGGFRGMPPI